MTFPKKTTSNLFMSGGYFSFVMHKNIVIILFSNFMYACVECDAVKLRNSRKELKLVRGLREMQ